MLIFVDLLYFFQFRCTCIHYLSKRTIAASVLTEFLSPGPKVGVIRSCTKGDSTDVGCEVLKDRLFPLFILCVF